MRAPRKPRLVSDWRTAWSVRVGALITVFGLLPPDQQVAIIAAIGIDQTRVPAVIGAIFLISRLWAQPPKQ